MRRALPRLLMTVALPLWLAGMAAHAQDAPAAPPASAAPTVDADPALWVVKDADTTIYLFGSVHVLKPGLSWFDEAVKDAFDKSDTLMLEMVEPAQDEMQALFLRTAIDAGGAKLSDRMTAEQAQRLAQAVKTVGLPDGSLEPFEPWAAGITITMMGIVKAGFDPASGAERTLTAAAKQAGKPIEGFETAAEQLGFFDSLPIATQVTFLDETNKQLTDAAKTMSAMVDAWAKGDADTLAKLVNEGMDDPAVAKALLTDRNARWAKALKARLDRPGTVFVAVGAGHLAGKGSVQDDLAALGVTVRRVAY